MGVVVVLSFVGHTVVIVVLVIVVLSFVGHTIVIDLYFVRLLTGGDDLGNGYGGWLVIEHLGELGRVYIYAVLLEDRLYRLDQV